MKGKLIEFFVIYVWRFLLLLLHNYAKFYISKTFLSIIWLDVTFYSFIHLKFKFTIK